MKLPSYKEMLEMGKEKLSQSLIPIKVNRQKKKAELELAMLEEEIAKAENDIQTECSQEDVDFKRIIKKQNDLGLLQRTKAQYEQILEQMFPAAAK